MRAPIIVGLIFLFSVILSGCGKGWKMDYGKPAAQFHQADLVAKGTPFVGEKITVKGIVEKIDVSDPKTAWVHLEGGVQCDFGKFKAMASSKAIGEEIYVDGFLVRCEEGDVLLSPALSRDPTAPFSPK